MQSPDHAQQQLLIDLAHEPGLQSLLPHSPGRLGLEIGNERPLKEVLLTQVDLALLVQLLNRLGFRANPELAIQVSFLQK